MPIYEYHCRSCKKDFEKLVLRPNQSITCPNCNSEKVQRLLSSFGFKDGSKTAASGAEKVTSGSSCASCISRNCSQCR